MLNMNRNEQTMKRSLHDDTQRELFKGNKTFLKCRTALPIIYIQNNVFLN